MSEKNQRHWLDLRHGHVETSDESDPRTRANYYEARPERYQEVQVAPLDAIVIDRADLPEVTTSKTKNGYTVVHAGEWTFDHHPDDVPTVESAKAYLAAALWFEANPPVDEAQVKALSQVIRTDEGWVRGDGLGTNYQFARRLVQRGVRVEVSDA